jgi:RND family efflux transporter MFP subunit
VHVWLALALLQAGCPGGSAGVAGQARALPVRLEPVRDAAADALLPEGVRYPGILLPAARVELGFEVMGHVADIARRPQGGGERLLQAGDTVRRGEVLARLRCEEPRQAAAAARAAVDEALALHEQAKRELEREQSLVAVGTVPAAQLEATRARHLSARAALEGARRRLSMGQANAARCVLRSPFEALVLRRELELGALVTPGQPLLSLGKVAAPQAEFAVPAAELRHLREGQPVTLLSALELTPGTGHVLSIAPAADPRTHLHTVQVQLSEPSWVLGGPVQLVLGAPSGLPASGLVVPVSALQRSPTEARGFAVFVAEQGEGSLLARARQVRGVRLIPAGVLVAEGLRPGELVVTLGAHRLREGQPIRPLPSASAEAP